jgi:hypothetical protein
MNAAFGVLFFFAFLIIILAIWFICLFGGGNAILIFGIIEREGRRGDVLNVFVLELLILFIILLLMARIRKRRGHPLRAGCLRDRDGRPLRRPGRLKEVA